MSKIVNLFDNNLKFKFLFLVFFMVIASFLELLGLGLVVLILNSFLGLDTSFLDILNDYLPKSLITKNKKGFLIPLKEWLINDLNEWANELLKPDKLNNFEEFNCEKIIYLWNNG